MSQSLEMPRQDRFMMHSDRTHYPDDREGAALLFVLLGAVGLTLLTTPAFAGLVTMVPLSAMVAEARTE